MTFLPSKKFIGGALGLLIVVVFGFFALVGNRDIFTGGSEPVATIDVQNSLHGAVARTITTADSDSDGLKDWEEELWGTDPHNPDSDNDGTRDGIEVDANRSPTKKGPDDSLTETLRELEEGVQDINITGTDKFAQSFFSDYLTLRRTGLLEGEEGYDFLLTSVSSDIPTVTGRTYRQADLRVQNSTSKEIIKAYGNAVATVLVTYGSQNVPHELAILDEAVVKGNEKAIEQLDVIIGSYGVVVEQLLLVSVPQNATATHLEFINALSGVQIAIQGLRNVFVDPITALSALGQYQVSAQELLASFQALEHYFAENNISYTETDPGYGLANISELLGL